MQAHLRCSPDSSKPLSVGYKSRALVSAKVYTGAIRLVVYVVVCVAVVERQGGALGQDSARK